MKLYIRLNSSLGPKTFLRLRSSSIHQVRGNLLKRRLNLLLRKPIKKPNSEELVFFSLCKIWNHLVTNLHNPWLAKGWKWVTRYLPRNCNHAVRRSSRHRGSTNKAKTDFLSVQHGCVPLHLHYCCLHESPPANSFFRGWIIWTVSVLRSFPLKKQKGKMTMYPIKTLNSNVLLFQDFRKTLLLLGKQPT